MPIPTSKVRGAQLQLETHVGRLGVPESLVGERTTCALSVLRNDHVEELPTVRVADGMRFKARLR